MVKIRMLRMGSKTSPFYRVIAIDERKQRDGRPLEFLGTYDPRVDPPRVNLNLDGSDAWTAKGAQLSDTIASVVRRVRRSGNSFSEADGALSEADSALSEADGAFSEADGAVSNAAGASTNAAGATAGAEVTGG